MANVLGIIRNKASGIMTKIRKNKININNVKQIYIGEGIGYYHTDTSVNVTSSENIFGLESNAYVFDHYIFLVLKDGSTSHKYQVYDLHNDAINANNYLIDPARQIARACSSSKTTVPSPQDNAFYIHFLVHNNELYALGGVSKTNTNSSWNTFKRYNPDSNTWINLTNLPIYFSRGVEVSAPSGIHIFQDLNHYYWDGSSWKQGADLLSPVRVSNTYSNAYANKTYDAFLQYDFLGNASNSLGNDAEVIVVLKHSSEYRNYCYFVNGNSYTSGDNFIDKMKDENGLTTFTTLSMNYKRSLSQNGIFLSIETEANNDDSFFTVSALNYHSNRLLNKHNYNYDFLVCYQGIFYLIGIKQYYNSSSGQSKYYYNCQQVLTTQNVKIENS